MRGLTRPVSISLAISALLLLVGVLPLSAGEGGIAGARFTARLVGAEEVPPVDTRASGELELTVVDAGTWLYTLSYRGIEGGDPLFSHIHIGDRGVNGSVIIFFCGGGGKPACPTAGSVSGTITASDVLVNEAEGLAAGDLDGAMRFIIAGRTYANLHNPQNPGGHIRGQIS
jgi:CHRD domain